MKLDRATRWSKLLKLPKNPQPLKDFPADSEHPDKEAIHKDCQEVHKTFARFEESELKDYLEYLVTVFCLQKGIPYTSGIHYLLAPFFLIGFSSLNKAYAAFCSFIKKMTPRAFKEKSSLEYTYKLFHSLLMYHEPFVCNFLDANMLSPQDYSHEWFVCLFATRINISILLAFWETCLQENNFTLPYFVGLVVIARQKEKILSKRNLEGGAFDFSIDELEEMDSVYQEAINLQYQTPRTFITIIEQLTLHSPESFYVEVIQKSIGLPILASDVQYPKPGLFVIDLRKAPEYLSGHYPQSFNIPKDLNLSTGKLYIDRGTMECVNRFFFTFHLQNFKALSLCYLQRTPPQRSQVR